MTIKQHVLDAIADAETLLRVSDELSFGSDAAYSTFTLLNEAALFGLGAVDYLPGFDRMAILRAARAAFSAVPSLGGPMVRCAWCSTIISGHDDSGLISHGICKPCVAKVRR